MPGAGRPIGAVTDQPALQQCFRGAMITPSTSCSGDACLLAAGIRARARAQGLHELLGTPPRAEGLIALRLGAEQCRHGRREQSAPAASTCVVGACSSLAFLEVRVNAVWKAAAAETKTLGHGVPVRSGRRSSGPGSRLTTRPAARRRHAIPLSGATPPTGTRSVPESGYVLSQSDGMTRHLLRKGIGEDADRHRGRCPRRCQSDIPTCDRRRAEEAPNSASTKCPKCFPNPG